MPLLDVWCHLLPACQTHCVHSFCTSRASCAQASLSLRKQSQKPGSQHATAFCCPLPCCVASCSMSTASGQHPHPWVGMTVVSISQPTAVERAGPTLAAVGTQGVLLLILPCWDTGCQLLRHVPPAPTSAFMATPGSLYPCFSGPPCFFSLRPLCWVQLASGQQPSPSLCRRPACSSPKGCVCAILALDDLDDLS